METCKNCGAELTGKYCSNCGQENLTSRLSVGHLFKDATHGILHWESSILKTFKELIIHPGKFIKVYLEGKRKSYVKPFSYFIFIQTAYALAFHWFSEKYFAFVSGTVTVNGEITESQAAKLEAIKHTISANITYFNYTFPLILAVFWFMFLKKKTGINYAESLVSGLYLVGTTLFFGVILMLLANILPQIWEIRFGVNYIYIIVAYIQYSGYSVFKGIIRSFALTFLSYIVYIIFVAAVTVFYLAVIKGIKL